MNQPLLEWPEQLAVGQAAMDDTHREFVELLNRIAAGEAEALAEWFPQHAGSMGAILALFMQQTGYTPASHASSTV